MAGLVSTAMQDQNTNQNDLKASPPPVQTVSNPTIQSMTGDQAKDVIKSSKSYYDTFNRAAPSATSPTPAPTTAPSAPQISAQGYSPSEWNVEQNQTVQGQIGGITRSGSPLMVQAETAGKQQAQRKGLLNSSLGISAAEGELYKAALPIASQDASTYAAAAQANQLARNRSSEFGAAAGNTASLAGAQILSQEQIAQRDVESRNAIAQLNADTQKAVSKMSSDTQWGIAQLDSTTKEKLQNIVSSNSQLLQASTSASNIMQQYMNSVANVQTSPNMDAGAKQKAVDNLLNIMNSQLKAVGDIAGLDLSKYFQPVAVEEQTPNTPNNPKFPEFDYLNVP